MAVRATMVAKAMREQREALLARSQPVVEEHSTGKRARVEDLSGEGVRAVDWVRNAERIAQDMRSLSSRNGEDGLVSSVFKPSAGEDTLEKYRYTLRETDQSELVDLPLTKLEDVAAYHSLAINSIIHHLHLRAACLQNDSLSFERKLNDANQKANYQVKYKELERTLNDTKHENVLLRKRVEELQMNRDREHMESFNAGRQEFVESDEYRSAMKRAREEGVRAFVKSNTYAALVAKSAAVYEFDGFEKCRTQAAKKDSRNNGNCQTQKNHKKPNVDLSASDDANEKNAEPTKMMKVPDPDFYDFDQDRTERSFADNDMWAAYDDDDGMPRFYALVHKVISKKPFKLKISWLNSKTTTEFGPGLDWVDSGFYKTCGEFWVGKHEVCKFVNVFSQKVKWSKGPRGDVVILPRKGDVWALYRNWSSDWDMRTPDDVIHKYDMVIVVDGYDEVKGEVCVAPLVKVVGYRTVFRPDMGNGSAVRITKEEIFRFSHVVPHHELTGHEASDLPTGCVELDPAATPLELLGMATGNGNVGPSGVNVETSPV